MLVSHACRDQVPQTGWLKITEIYSRTVLGARSLKWGSPGGNQGVGRASCLLEEALGRKSLLASSVPSEGCQHPQMGPGIHSGGRVVSLFLLHPHITFSSAGTLPLPPPSYSISGPARRAREHHPVSGPRLNPLCKILFAGRPHSQVWGLEHRYLFGGWAQLSLLHVPVTSLGRSHTCNHGIF